MGGLREVWFDALDRVVSKMQTRFQSSSSGVLVALADIFSSAVTDEISYRRVAEFCNIEQVDILKVEKNIFVGLPGKPEHESLVSLLKILHPNSLPMMLPNFASITQIFNIMPAISCSAEQSFSCL